MHTHTHHHPTMPATKLCKFVFGENKFDKIVQQINSDESSSDEGVIWGGSRPDRLPNIEQEWELGALKLFNNCSSANATYPECIFKRRFWPSQSFSERVRHSWEASYLSFQHHWDESIRWNAYQNCTTVVSMIAYGISGNILDEYLPTADCTAVKCSKLFC